MESPSPSHRTSYVSTTKPSPVFRCRQCNSRQGARNLVVCIDGTSNQFGHNNTNVVKLFAKIDLETIQPAQFAYYSSGIGTRPKSMDILDRMKRAVSDKFDMAIAWNMEEIVKDAYGWLARTYNEGDQVYLFGFSRGAYQVRVLAGMIHEVGLIRTPTEKQIGTAYDHYEAIRSNKPKTRQIAREFKNTFSWKGLRVHFVGVWDTVSSVGLIRGDVFLSTSSSAAHACHFRHALALDERRVKFMPEYFHEMNSQTNDGESKYIVRTPDAVSAGTSANGEGTDPGVSGKAHGKSKDIDAGHNEHPASTSNTSNNGTEFSGSKKVDGVKSVDPSSDVEDKIKEVWFAGSHSDVGGKNRPGISHQAGNVSLLWMRREANKCGLVLKPTDIVWVPDDIDFGFNDSMTMSWKIIEQLPITHQVSFSGAGENDRRRHQLRPRRIIPGQKVHASILYANAYQPAATLGEGFDIPTIQAELGDTELDKKLWETGLFDDTAAQELVAYLGGQQGVAPIYLDRLLFMLRFEEGKRCVRNVPGWREQFMSLMKNSNCAPLVKLVTIVAYYEASYDPEVNPASPAPPHKETSLGSPASSHEEPSTEVFSEAKDCFSQVLKAHKHRDGPRVVALLRPLTRHRSLRERILTPDVLKALVGLLDQIVGQTEGNFAQAMDGLNCLLQCEGTRQFLIKALGENFPGSNESRLAKILGVKDPRFLIATLRMVSTLSRIPEETAKAVCNVVKPRLMSLAKSKERLVGILAVEILLALFDLADPVRLNIHDALVRVNLASALARLDPDRRDPAIETILQTLFGFGSTVLQPHQRKLIAELKAAARHGNAQERTAATMTLLNLCTTKAIRDYLLEINLLDAYIDQMQRKDSALLAAYALAVCLKKYHDMKESVKDNERLPKHIVGMLRLDYFDDAVGPVEGFQIFGDFMQQDDLRKKIENYDITKILDSKLGRGKTKETRTSLICLDIFRSFDANGPWTGQLVDRSLRYLEKPTWKSQKAGVTILSALAKTEHGVAAIEPKIPEIIGMLLPDDYQLITPTTGPSVKVETTIASTGEGSAAVAIQPDVARANPASEGSAVVANQPDVTTAALAGEGPAVANQPESDTSQNSSHKTPSWMLGPACALRTLAQNKTLRDRARGTAQYGSLKHLYLSGTLVDGRDTRAWRVFTPTRADVTEMLDKLIKAVDEELSEEGLMSVGDTVLPHIQHWDRFWSILRNRTAAVVTLLPGLFGVSVLAILAAIVVPPVYLSARTYRIAKDVLLRQWNSFILDRLNQSSVAGLVRQGAETVVQGAGTVIHGAGTVVHGAGNVIQHGAGTVIQSAGNVVRHSTFIGRHGESPSGDDRGEGPSGIHSDGGASDGRESPLSGDS